MLFKSVFALVLLATVVSGRTLTLKELLKRAINSFPDPNDGPVVSALNCVTNYLLFVILARDLADQF